MSRIAFGKTLAEHSVWEQRIADARIDIEMSRLLCLKAADMMDKAGNKAAQAEIAMIKVAAPRMALQVIDDAIQAHGGAGVCRGFRAGERAGPAIRRCGSPTAPTKCTTGRSPGWNLRNIDERATDSMKRRSGRGSKRMCRGFADRSS